MEKIWIAGDGVELEGVFTDLKGGTAVVITHPHPLYGGNMDNYVVTTIEQVCIENNISSLRFNFRGTGTSTGFFDDGQGEAEDVAAAVEWLKGRFNGRVILAGYSFGSRVNATAIMKGVSVSDHIMVSPPVAFMSFDDIDRINNTGLIITGEHDDIAPPAQVADHIERWGLATRFEIIPGCDHFYSGGLGQLETILGDYLSNTG